MAQLRITTINSSLLLSKSANRAAGEPRYSISQCFTLCDVESQLIRHILQHSRHSCTQAIDSEADDQQPKDATSKASQVSMQLQQGRARQHGTHEVLWHDAHEFDHKGCIIVEEEAQAGGDQREEDLRPAAQVQALL
mmetsp:Transcript_24746/g.51317  ORF Transcript_24746/g.51317 Transcript_24746/m.51317 type:complete len:137 (-) Transcript_24746:1699-2109(-)